MNLHDLDEVQRQRVLAGSRTSSYARNAAVYRPDEASDRFHFIEQGRVKIVRTHISGAETIVGIRAEGDIFGELSAIGHRERSTSAIAIEPTVVRSVAAPPFLALLADDPALALHLARGIARRLATAERELTELAGKSVPGRLVDTLGRLAASYGVDDDDGAVRIGIHLTHRDLADLIGTSRETLTKELGVLADVGLVRVTHKSVTLVRPAAFPFVKRREAS